MKSLKTVSGYDIAAARADFPALESGLAYLDSAASAQKPRAVIDTMSGVMENHYANIHRGLYDYSQRTTRAFEDVRGQVARFINAGENEIVFTRNTTEAVNLLASTMPFRAGDEIILTQMEHHANLVPWLMVKERAGVILKYMPVREDGSLDTASLSGLLSDKTRLVTFTHISNALGTINPAADIVKTVKAYNPAILTLVDGSQSAVHRAIDVRQLGCDFFVMTGHKLYGPSGVGVLYGRYEALDALPPYQGGGDMIDRVREQGVTFKSAPHKFEAGTPAIVEVIGLGAAIDYIGAIGFDAIEAHEKKLADAMFAMLEGMDGVRMMGRAPARAGIASFVTDWGHPSDIGMILDKCGVAVRTGHHCCQPLMDVFSIDATVRASLGLYSNMDDIDKLAAGLTKAKAMLA